MEIDQIFNHERPHEGINNAVPASFYQRNAVLLPRTVTDFTYPRGVQTRRVNSSGDISWHEDRVFLSEVFSFEDLGFEEMDEDLFRVTSATSNSANSMCQSCGSGQ